MRSTIDLDARPREPIEHLDFETELASFQDFGSSTRRFLTPGARGERGAGVPTFANEFWTARQRAAQRLHEISYRGCFKPQLPRFFVERLSRPGERVYDPFMGRGTTLLEAALLGRAAAGNDVNPLAALLVAPRLNPPTLADVEQRLAEIPLERAEPTPPELTVFFPPETLAEIAALRAYLIARESSGRLDPVDAWIRMVALNRLTGHSPGFLSVYTLPPNQATSVTAQRKINARRRQQPERRELRAVLRRKSRSLLSQCDAGLRARLASPPPPVLLTALAESTPELADGSVDLVVTSPPFLDVVDYAGDNWLRCWFAGIDPAAVALTVPRRLSDWEAAMARVFAELRRVVRPEGHIAFEVGEVRRGALDLDRTVIDAGRDAGLLPRAIVRQEQVFTKTAQCWGVDNGRRGTNSHRIVVFRRIP